MRVLFAAGEALPFSKTGGLADVAFALPSALARGGVDVRVITPAYAGAIEKLQSPQRIAEVEVRGQAFSLWEGRVEPGGFIAWLVDCPALYARAGTPYGDAQGREYGDNAWRFGCFSEAIARFVEQAPGGWRPQVVHLNDWHCGLVPVWLARMAAPRPATVFTIHNLAYQGQFDRADFNALGMPPELWHMDALEFHGGFSFMKGALLNVDALTTVSPTYALEIQTPAYGERMEGVIRSRAASLHGIVNGIDVQAWNPATDPHLPAHYDVSTLDAGKRVNKRELQQRMGLEIVPDRPLLGFIGRLAYQKGADLLIAAAAWLAEHGVQVALLGAGDAGLETAFRNWARDRPGQVGVRIGYDETLAHLIEAGSDFFLMPSRYEPCGLNQMYSQRYGTIPIVRKTGGLADTVIDVDAASPAEATGVVFEHADVGGVTYGLQRALDVYRQPALFKSIRVAGMRRDFGWDASAKAYVALYETLLAKRPETA